LKNAPGKSATVEPLNLETLNHVSAGGSGHNMLNSNKSRMHPRGKECAVGFGSQRMGESNE
jgi:hypothetical protein